MPSIVDVWTNAEVLWMFDSIQYFTQMMAINGHLPAEVKFRENTAKSSVFQVSTCLLFFYHQVNSAGLKFYLINLQMDFQKLHCSSFSFCQSQEWKFRVAMQFMRISKVSWLMIIEYSGFHCKKYQIIYASVHSYLCACKHPCKREFVWNVHILAMLKVISFSVILNMHKLQTWLPEP